MVEAGERLGMRPGPLAHLGGDVGGEGSSCGAVEVQRCEVAAVELREALAREPQDRCRFEFGVVISDGEKEALPGLLELLVVASEFADLQQSVALPDRALRESAVVVVDALAQAFAADG